LLDCGYDALCQSLGASFAEVQKKRRLCQLDLEDERAIIFAVD
jgi:nitrate/nitrite-specific signal transduction histidine kinase